MSQNKCLHGMYLHDGFNPCYYCQNLGISGPSQLPSQMEERVPVNVEMTEAEVADLEVYPSERHQDSFGRWYHVFRPGEYADYKKGKGQPSDE